MAQTKVIGGGTVVPGVELGIDPTFQAARMSIRPYDYQLGGQILGHYRVAATTAAILPSANAVLFNFRWADPSRFAVIMRLSAAVSVVTAVTPQRTDPLLSTVQRIYTVSETTNATSVLPTQNTGKARVNMGTTLATQIAVTSAAAGLTGGTKTADAQAFGALALTNLGAIGTGVLQDDFVRFDELGMHPLVLSANEGITVSWGATALATGTVEVTVMCSWAEVVTF
jgi:hypothetical protein